MFPLNFMSATFIVHNTAQSLFTNKYTFFFTKNILISTFIMLINL